MDIVRINDKRGVVEVNTSRGKIEGAPSLGSGDEISPEVEDSVRAYYGLKPLHSPDQSHGDTHTEGSVTEDPLAFDERIDLIPGEREASQERFEGAPPYRERDEQLRRNEEREAEHREAAEREAAEREAEHREAAEREAAHNEAAERELIAEHEAAEREANLRRSTESREAEGPRDETGSRGESAASRVRRLNR